MPAIRAQTAVSPFDGVMPGFWFQLAGGDGTWVGSAQSAWGLNQGMSATEIQNAILAIYKPLLSITVGDEWVGKALPTWYTRTGNVVKAQLVGLTIEVVGTNPLRLNITTSDGASKAVRVGG